MNKASELFEQVLVNGQPINLQELDENEGKIKTTKNERIKVDFVFKNKTNIPANLFSNLSNLESSHLSNTVTTIEHDAYANSKLKSINLDNVDVIDNNAFTGTKLSKLNIDNAKYVSDTAFTYTHTNFDLNDQLASMDSNIIYFYKGQNPDNISNLGFNITNSCDYAPIKHKPVIYKNIIFTSGIKLDKNASFEFTAKEDAKLRFVLSTARRGTNIKVNGEFTKNCKTFDKANCRLIDVDVLANETYTITKGKNEMIISLIEILPAESQEDTNLIYFDGADILGATESFTSIENHCTPSSIKSMPVLFNNQIFTNGLKFDSHGSLSFTSNIDGTIKLILSTFKKGTNLKVNNVLTTECDVYDHLNYYAIEIKVEKNQNYTITKGKSEAILALIEIK